MSENAILAIDQGTTSSRAIVFSNTQSVISIAQQEYPQIYPHKGWVEHDPVAIWQTTLHALLQAVSEANEKGYIVKTAGITNQRETTIVWDKRTDEPLYNAIVWQDKRTTLRCDELKQQGIESQVKQLTGLTLDPYFSATKLEWILQTLPNESDIKNLAFGTVDTWLLWKLTQGQVHATDHTNASRTLLFDIHHLAWSEHLAKQFNIPTSILPTVHPSVHHFGDIDLHTLNEGRYDLLPSQPPIQIRSIAGDQQAAAIGQQCFTAGTAKATFGTGCFLLANTGQNPQSSSVNLLSTVGLTHGSDVSYALEGSIFMAGAAIQWLRDNLGIIKSAGETDNICRQLDSNNGVYVVPAFTGLGAPYWSANAKASITGLSRDSDHRHIVRATIEAVAYQANDLITAIEKDGIQINELRIDGGMAKNTWFCQFLADISGKTIQVPETTEATALGISLLAGMGQGIYENTGDLNKFWRLKATYKPTLSLTQRNELLKGWDRAVQRVIDDGSH